MTPANKRKALKKARDLREEFRKEGEFTQPNYRAALADVLAEFKDDAFDGFVDNVAETVDRQATVRERPEQRTLFGTLEGEYKLGDSRRIATRLALIDHADASMAIADRNAAAVLMSLARDREELARLRPYWFLPRTKEEAVAAYYEANPPDENRAS